MKRSDLPTCKTCEHFSGGPEELRNYCFNRDTFQGHDLGSAAHFHPPSKDFGCVLHSDLEQDAEDA